MDIDLTKNKIDNNLTNNSANNLKNNSTDNSINILRGYKKFHLIGIGGAGMSAIAFILKGLGAEVKGSDLKRSRYTNLLVNENIEVYIGHDDSNVGNADAVIYSTAINDNNVELVQAKKRGIPVFTRGEVLSWILNNKKGIAVTGTHGKTTTTSMIALILNGLKLDPIVLIGGELNELGSNARYGNGEFLVAEACESDGTFLSYKPYVSVITNIEDDHLDYWKTLKNLKENFLSFLKNTKNDGFIVINGDDKDYIGTKSLENLKKEINRKIITFGLESYNTVSAKDIKLFNFSSSYKLLIKDDLKNDIENFENDKLLEADVKLNVPGMHNVLNSLAAFSVIYGLGLDIKEAVKLLEFFTGAKRRFEKRGEKKGALIFDDYAHHPTEVKATLQTALMEKKNGRIITVFQPHRYTRLLNLHEKFSLCFDNCDILVVSDIFGSDEKPIPGVTGKLLIDSLIENGFKNRLVYIPKLLDIKDFLLENIKENDIVLIMGAGDITQVSEELLKS